MACNSGEVSQVACRTMTIRLPRRNLLWLFLGRGEDWVRRQTFPTSAFGRNGGATPRKRIGLSQTPRLLGCLIRLRSGRRMGESMENPMTSYGRDLANERRKRWRG